MNDNPFSDLQGADGNPFAAMEPSGSQMTGFIIIMVIMIAVICLTFLLIHKTSSVKLKGGKERVDDGPLGDAKFADDKQLEKEYPSVAFEPEKWRKGEDLPNSPGLLLGDQHVSTVKHPVRKQSDSIPYYIKREKVETLINGKKVKKQKPIDITKHPEAFTGGKVKTRVCTDDVHAMIVASSGAGKSAFWLYPNMEYALACGQSFVVTDTKGDNARKYAYIAQHDYGYNARSLDLRNVMRSCRFNLLSMTNKYSDLYKKCADKRCEKALRYAAKREMYAKITAQTIIKLGNEDGDKGANKFFYDAAQGLLQSCILLISEYAEPQERHIKSVYTLVQEGTKIEGKAMKLARVFNMLDPDDPILMLAGPALTAPPETVGSIVSTAMTTLQTFLDSEMDQIMCGDSDIDAEDFCSHKTVLFITMPEENSTRYFMVSLLIEELYRELLTIADRNNGHIPAPEGFRGDIPRITFFLDEFGTLPKINKFELMMSAARSRGIFFVPILQGTSQLERNYGKESAKIIMDNCKLTYFSGISSSSDDAEVFSKLLGKYTVTTSSISDTSQGASLFGAKSSSRSVQMSAIDLMSPEEIRHKMKKGDFVILRTSEDPIYTHFDLFSDWGIGFETDVNVPERSMIQVKTASFDEIQKTFRQFKIQQTKSQLVQSTRAESNQTQDDFIELW